MRGKADIAVAGAGAIGSTIALTLARAGHRVRVFDPAPPDAGASGVAAGMLAPAFEALFDEASHGRFELFRAARDLWLDLAKSIGLPLDRAGAMALGSSEEVAHWADQLAALGATASVLGPAKAAALAPGLAGGLNSAFSPDDWRLEPLAALTALHAAAEAAGATLISAPFTEADWARADLVVIATGASRSLVGLAPELAKLTPFKGQILRASGVVAPRPVIRGAGVYLCASADGLILGASMEPGRDDLEIDAAVVADLIARTARVSPRLAELDWTARVGVRAATADGLPLVGEGTAPGVILAVGARRNGWLLAPMIAEVVADLIEGRPRSLEAELFDPRRPLSPG